MSAELDRLRREYEERDRAGQAASGVVSPYPAQRLEATVAAALASAGFDCRGAAVLDVGCGDGTVLHRFLEAGAARAAGIELLDARAAAARARDARLEIVTGDASELPFEDASFDLVTQFMALSAVMDAALRRRVADEMWRVTKPGGVVLSYDMRPPTRTVRLLAAVLPPLLAALRRSGEHGTGPITPYEPLDRRELATLFPHGARSVRAATLHSPLATAARRSRALARALEALPNLRSHYVALVRKPEATAR